MYLDKPVWRPIPPAGRLLLPPSPQVGEAHGPQPWNISRFNKNSHLAFQCRVFLMEIKVDLKILGTWFGKWEPATRSRLILDILSASSQDFYWPKLIGGTGTFSGCQASFYTETRMYTQLISRCTPFTPFKLISWVTLLQKRSTSIALHNCTKWSDSDIPPATIITISANTL